MVMMTAKTWTKAVSRTDKECSDFRNYENNLQTDIVRKTYTVMHTHQTMEFVKGKIEKWGQLNKTHMSIMDALSLLDSFIDECDPDTDLPNSIHAYQTAERIRAAHPDKDWLHLVGLVHDLGKVLAIWGEPQWAVVGDTFPLGCKFSRKIVFADTFVNNPDTQNQEYNSKCGIYGANCGLDNVTMSWGHDVRHEEILHNMEKAMAEFVGLENLKEQFMRFTKTQLQNDRRRMLGHNVQDNTPLHLVFAGNPGTGKTTFARRVAEYMYRVLKGNDCKIPDQGLYMVRYHSFYPWHASGEYDHLCSDRDREMLPWVKEFSKYDLYSKSDQVPNMDSIKPYYEGLIDKYCPGELRW